MDYIEKAKERALEREFPGYATLPRRFQRAWAGWLRLLNFELFITVNSNDDTISSQRGREGMKRLFALMDAYFLGPRWRQFESMKRTLAIAVAERRGGKLHYHVLAKLPPGTRKDRRSTARLEAHLKWNLQKKRIFPRGDVDVQHISRLGVIENTFDQRNTVNYAAKDLWKEEARSGFILSTEFHHRPKRSKMTKERVTLPRS